MNHSVSPESPRFDVFCVGEFHFHARTYELHRAGDVVRLPRRLSMLLLRLIEVAPAVLSRSELIELVWQRRMVEDEVLSRAIADLRKALGDDPRTPRYIETIHKAGYRVCAQVNPIAPEALALAAKTTTPKPAAAQRDGPDVGRGHWLGQRREIWLLAALLVGLVGMTLRPSTTDPWSVADMSRVRPLTSAAGWELYPTLSADGYWLAYTVQTLQAESSQLVLESIDGKHRELLETGAGNALRPTLAGDARQVLFLRLQDGRCELHLRSLPGAGSRRLADCAVEALSTPAWSADHQRVVYTAPALAGQAPALVLLDLVSGKQRRLTRPSRHQGPDRDPKFIPGLSAITFARGFDGEQTLMRMDLRQSSAPPFALIPAGRLQGHAWRSDGRQLLLATDQPGYRTLVRYDRQGRQIEILAARGARYPTWADNGELVFESAQFDANIWKVSLDKPMLPQVAVINSTRYDASPALSPDGHRLAFVTNRNDFEQIFVGNSDGSDQQRLALDDRRRWSRPSFSRDGSGLLLTGYDDADQQAIYHYQFGTGRVARLDELGTQVSSGRYSLDGHRIYFLRQRSDGARDLWFQGLTDGSGPTQLGGAEGVEQYLPGAGFILVYRGGRNGFRVLEGEGRAEVRDILPGVQPIADFAWTVQGRRLYVAVRESGGPVLKRWDLDTLEETVVTHNFGADAVGPALVVSEDETTAWFARTDHLTIDLMRLPAIAD
ncbi:MAG: LpqB family beta-propeller domain-containing protein [Lysobacterales bacterium]